MLFPMLLMTLESDSDRNKIIEIYKKYYGLMLYIAKKVLTDRALAEDAVSESIEKIINNLHKIGDISCYRTRSLIVIIVRNTALNILKKEKRTEGPDIGEMEIAGKTPYVDDEVLNLEGYKTIVGIINSLPDTYRDVAILLLLHGYEYQEAAKILDISYEAVKMRISRAKKMIRTKLTGKQGGD